MREKFENGGTLKVEFFICSAILMKYLDIIFAIINKDTILIWEYSLLEKGKFLICGVILMKFETKPFNIVIKTF